MGEVRGEVMEVVVMIEVVMKVDEVAVVVVVMVVAEEVVVRGTAWLEPADFGGL